MGRGRWGGPGWLDGHARVVRPDDASWNLRHTVPSGHKEDDIAATIGPSAATYTEATSRTKLAAACPSGLLPA